MGDNLSKQKFADASHETGMDLFSQKSSSEESSTLQDMGQLARIIEVPDENQVESETSAEDTKIIKFEECK